MDDVLNSKFEKLIRGQITYKSNNLGLNLLISRLQRKYTANQADEVLNNCLKEMDAFFEKYQSVLTKDVESLKNL